MKKHIMLFAIFANFLIVGCGGGSSYSTLDDDLPTPTAKLKQSQAQDIIETIHKSQLDPMTFLNGNSNNERFTKLKNTIKSMKVTSAKSSDTEACSNGGTKEIKVISGEPEDEDSTSGTYKYQTIFKKCKEDNDITIDGTVNTYEEWNKKDDMDTYTAKYESKNLVYIKDDKHKLTITNFSLNNSGAYNIYHNGHNSKGDSKYTYSAKLINGDETLEFKNIKRVKKFKYIDHDGLELYNYYTLTGAINSTKLKGWITIQTPTPYEKTEKDKVEDNDVEAYCNHTGKLVIKGADHTITQEVASDHSITEKFDNSTIKKYKNCIEYYK